MIWLQELVSVYTDHHPDSIAAVNVRACNLFRLTGDHAATVGALKTQDWTTTVQKLKHYNNCRLKTLDLVWA